MAPRSSRETPVTLARGKYAGVLSIVRYNWHFYAASLCVLLAIAALLWFRLLPRPWVAILILAASLTAFWSLCSLFVSYYVYDYISVTEWKWIPGVLSFPPRQWANIHAGLDDSTPLLKQLFPNTRYVVIDIYDSAELTEVSIARARRLQPPPEPPVSASLDALPLPDQDRDTLFVLFAAHEIRQAARRAAFFREAVRVLGDSGQLLLVEHLRDWTNFLAFGPGFLHFHSRYEWIRLAHNAGLTMERENRVTPFVRSFLLRKARR